ncbi:NACHT and Ankyrin domain protein [Apiospora kogelbergensis]|uniref:NACHT and Ankyrin domain protein n=1 Tax=Apiospora kogelbergensis TaxID=1337665 RepID=A0AAW0Q2S6_9PEZI
MAEAIGAIAAGIEIAKFSKDLTRWILDIADDTSGIRKTLLHFRDIIDGTINLYADIEATIKEQNLSETDGLVVVVSDSGEHCRALLEKLQGQLPELAEDAGIGRRAKAALYKKLNEKVIQEQLTFLQHYMQMAQLALSQIESRRMSTINSKIDQMKTVIDELATVLAAVPPYTPGTVDESDYNRLQGNLQNLRDVAIKEKTGSEADLESIYDRMPSGSDELPQVLLDLIREVRPSTPPPQQDTMGDLEAKGMLLKASKVVLPFGEEYIKHDENRADLLTRCSTIRLQQRALNILERLWEMESRKEETHICPERLGRLGSKLARLYMDSQRIGHITDSQRTVDRARARDVLYNSLALLLKKLETDRPFPWEITFTVGELLISLLKATGKASEASRFEQAIPYKLRKELETGPAPVHIPPDPDWPRKFEPSVSPALTWCGQDNLATILGVWPDKTAVATRPADITSKLDVRSLDFRFDKPVSGLSPLHLAAIYGKKDILEEMLGEVEDVDVGKDEASTPLIEAARSGNEETVQLLLDHEASVGCIDAKMGRTALHWAQTSEAHNGVSAAKLLLDRESELLLEMKDKDGKTALYLACESGNRDMADLLVKKHKAKVDITDLYQKTALHATVDAKDRLDERLHIAETLLKADAEPDTCDTRKHTPLCTASSLGHVELVKMLLEYGADPNLQGHEGETPLIAATRRNHTEVVRALRLRGADPNTMDAWRRSALDYARRNPPTSRINQLLRGSPQPLHRHRTSLTSVRSGLSVRSEPLPRIGTANGSTLQPDINRTSTQGPGRRRWWRRSG